jgi:glycosyltransferase involved in cell wall biosynthesis
MIAKQSSKENGIRLVVVIPAYNEEVSISQTMRDYQGVFPEASILVVDNNSRDGTQKAAASSLRPKKDLLLFEGRQGKGYAVKKGLSRLEADVFIMTDGDMTYPAKDARALYDLMLSSRVDMIVGDRRAAGVYDAQNSRFGHNLGNRMLTGLISRLAGQQYNDVLSGLRIMSAPFVECLDIRSEGFQLETEINIVAAYLRAEVLEVPIRYQGRPDGSLSKLSTVKDGMRILTFAIFNWIAFLPLQFFSIVAILGWGAASLLGYRVVSGFLHTGWPFSTTAIAGVASALVGTMAIFTGLSLKIQGRLSRRTAISSFQQRKRLWNTILDAAST